MKQNHRALTGPHRALTALITAGAVIIGALPALALWTDSGTAGTPEFPIGSVAFGVAPVNPNETPNYAPENMSVAGAPVTLRIPGQMFADAAILPNQPTQVPIFEFVLAGMSPESVGVQYLISAVGQYGIFDDESQVEHWVTRHPDQGVPWDGIANPYSLLAYSTVQIYPATSGADGADLAADCGAAPPLLDPPPASNVLVYDLNRNLATGSEAAMGDPAMVSDLGVPEPANTPSEQYWCVAITVGEMPDMEKGYYVNEFTAIGQGCAAATLDPDTNQLTCTDWQTLLDRDGDPILVSDTEQWWVEVVPPKYPEPDLVLWIDPSVIHITSLHSPGTPADPSFDIPSDNHPTSTTPNLYFSPTP